MNGLYEMMTLIYFFLSCLIFTYLIAILRLRQRLFNILHPVVGYVTGEIEGPFGAAVFAGEPSSGRAQGGEHVRVNLAVPGEDFLDEVAPALVDRGGCHRFHSDRALRRACSPRWSGRTAFQ